MATALTVKVSEQRISVGLSQHSIISWFVNSPKARKLSSYTNRLSNVCAMQRIHVRQVLIFRNMLQI